MVLKFDRPNSDVKSMTQTPGYQLEFAIKVETRSCEKMKRP